MIFNTINFFIFLCISLIAYYSIKLKYRWIILLISSGYFYFSLKPDYIIIFFITLILNYFFAINIQKTESLVKRRLLLAIIIIYNILSLFIFKYFNFFNETFSIFLNNFGLGFDPFFLKIILPIGISFYTFQNIGYIVDVYNKKINPEKNLGVYSLFVLYFPKFISGPIERASNFIPQITKEHSFEYENFKKGLKRILWGFFKKLVIADRLAVLVNLVYSSPGDYNGLPLILATVCFAFQLYCDFSGYTDIAIGVSNLFGIKLMENFNRPYSSKSVSEFWKRWHISLSSWFQDYVFVPFYLFISNIKILQNLSTRSKHLFSFAISIIIGEILLGLWHGPNLTFAVFGFYFGLVILGYYLIRDKWDRMPNILKIALTFFLVNIAWIFFRANSLNQAIYIILHLFSNFRISGVFFGIGRIEFFITILAIIIMEITDYIDSNKKINLNKWVYWTLYMGLIIFVLMFGIFKPVQFIYPRF